MNGAQLLERGADTSSRWEEVGALLPDGARIAERLSGLIEVSFDQLLWQGSEGTTTRNDTSRLNGTNRSHEGAVQTVIYTSKAARAYPGGTGGGSPSFGSSHAIVTQRSAHSGYGYSSSMTSLHSQHEDGALGGASGDGISPTDLLRLMTRYPEILFDSRLAQPNETPYFFLSYARRMPPETPDTWPNRLHGSKPSSTDRIPKVSQRVSWNDTQAGGSSFGSQHHPAPSLRSDNHISESDQAFHGDNLLAPCALAPGVALRFENYYRRQMASLIRFIMRLGTDPHTAADIAQSAFIEALPQWDSIERPNAWLRKVSERMFFRAKSREVPVGQVADHPAPLRDVVELKEEAQIVYRAIAQLPPSQRIVMAWKLDGYEYSEIADHLGITEATARQRYKRAWTALQTLLSGSLPRSEQ